MSDFIDIQDFKKGFDFRNSYNERSIIYLSKQEKCIKDLSFNVIFVKLNTLGPLSLQ